MASATCTRCGGTKKIAPMGGIQIDCTVCHGKGYLTPAEMDALLKPTIATLPKSATYDEPLHIAKAEDHAPAINGMLDALSPAPKEAIELPPTMVTVKKKPGRKPGWNKPQQPILQCKSETVTITE